MPLSQAMEREQIHNRTISITAYQRTDGLVDVEGHILDIKPFSHHLLDSHRAAGEPVHDLWLRLTVDQGMVVQSAEAKLDVGAHGICHLVAPNFKALAGLKIGPGWNRMVRERVGHGKGCTHLVEMLAQMATTAMQAMWTERAPAGAAREAAADATPKRLPDGMKNTCFTYNDDSEFVRKYFPDDYRAAE
ncbi:MAG: DUF2889 domain-containing protein [Rhodospirillaceae bacterium]|jgi:hypothetical protein|nr:DUF2889 domain-containing protein [Rhodospirillaceae bacterium]MBT4042655.1 DUF2889 domain-containing protein [Rhodospirillaceae bacterium]MBT4691029.1 DUF2889 domain-containing protein [Rhodospirillaceae bacterium]MBT5079917.1 DUF2889 domain-containing protein [Rhodospirillaceae bacterium]MBT5525939.1 DUF2889 domain-containing protein [Rhodospirillaceae bacterium]